MKFIGSEFSTNIGHFAMRAPVANTTDGASFGFSSTGEHMIRITSTGVFLANATIAGDLTVQGTTSSQGESESTDIVLTPASAPSPTTNKLYNLSSGGLTFSGSKVITTTATPGAAQIYFGDDNGDIITSSNCQFNLTSTNVLTITGDISATGDLITEASDSRLKDVSGVITDGLSRIQNINPVEFKWNEEAQTKYDADDNPHVGLIAQEVEATVPEIVKPSPWNGQYKTLQYEKMVPILLSAIKELNEKVEKLEQQLEKHNHE